MNEIYEAIREKISPIVDELFRSNETSVIPTSDFTSTINLFKDLIAKTLSEAVPEKKNEFETCTKCGGLGRIPNHPHIKAHTCDKCNGSRKIIRVDYKAHNAFYDKLLSNLKGKR